MSYVPQWGSEALSRHGQQIHHQWIKTTDLHVRTWVAVWLPDIKRFWWRKREGGKNANYVLGLAENTQCDLNLESTPLCNLYMKQICPQMRPIDGIEIVILTENDLKSCFQQVALDNALDNSLFTRMENGFKWVTYKNPTVTLRFSNERPQQPKC